MKKDILYAVGVVVALIALHTGMGHAQQEYIEPMKQMKPANCWPIMYALEGIKDQKMNVLWQAQNLDDEWQNNIVLFTGNNNEWVILEMNDEVACVLGSGDSFILLNNVYKGDPS